MHIEKALINDRLLVLKSSREICYFLKSILLFNRFYSLLFINKTLRLNSLKLEQL